MGKTKRKLKIPTNRSDLVGINQAKLIYVTHVNRDDIPVRGVLPEKGYFFIVLVILYEDNFQPYRIFTRSSPKSYINYKSRLGEYVDIVEPPKKEVEPKKKGVK